MLFKFSTISNSKTIILTYQTIPFTQLLWFFIPELHRESVVKQQS